MQISKNVSLASYTSFGTGGLCEVFAVADTVDDLREIIATQPRPFWILGKGANSLISDKGLPGTTIHIKLSAITFEDDGLAIAEAGVLWDTLVGKAIEHELWGLELMSGIPGTVGAAVAGNIAAYGQAVSDTLKWIEVIDYNKTSLGIQKMQPEEADLGYRRSGFTKGNRDSMIIVRTAFALSKSQTKPLRYESALRVAEDQNLDTQTLDGLRKIIMATRAKAGSLLDAAHQQKTAGSFFKNPYVQADQLDMILAYEEHSVAREQILQQNRIHGGDTLRVPAALVLLAAGFHRGQSWGSVRLHPEHVLKIENTGGATSQQIYHVARHIIAAVKEKLGIDLEPEVRFLGEFND
jgi:UDP-N-acetylmuramate dehydrogenase